MSITIKTPEEIEKMRVAGRLAAEVLDYITPSSGPASPPANSTALP
jgi:methionyl aminopeptidase